MWRSLERGDSVKLPSPRRVGKTSFARKLLDRATEKGWKTIELNLEGCRNDAEFLNRFLKELNKIQEQSKATAMFERLKKLAAAAEIDIEVAGFGKLALSGSSTQRRLYDECADALKELGPTLIFFDELREYLNNLSHTENPQAASEFLHWFRTVRQERSSEVRWLVASSIGIESFAFRERLSATINDFEDYHLKPFGRGQMLNMVISLANGADIELSHELCELLVDRGGDSVPYFVQLLFSKMLALHEAEDFELNEKTIEEAYCRLREGTELNTWIERLESNYADDELAAIQHVLLELTKRPQALSSLTSSFDRINLSETKRAATIKEMVNNLVRDGYLIAASEDDYEFRNVLLLDFWAHRHN